ncbi:hypothetical protein [Pontimicrobium sp. MEBiC06410]
MKLSKEEIQFIDQYLIKNGVKYWDVRLELLDHIILAVEYKITNEGISFNEALIEVHKGFGNTANTYGVSLTSIFNKALYSDNKGFNKFTLSKQKELGRKLRKQIWRTVLDNFKTPKFLLEYIVIIFSLFIVFQNSEKAALILGVAFVFVPYTYILLYGVNKKFIRKSLNMSLVTNQLFGLVMLVQLPLNTMNLFYDKGEPKPYIIFIIMIFVLYPFVRASIDTYLKTANKYKTYYKLMHS